MNRKKHLYGVLLTGMLAMSGTTFAATPTASMLANTCAGCHGPKGVSHGESPSIAGVPKHIIIKKMKGFKKGRAANTIMTRIAKGYTDKEIELIAGFYAQQKPAKQ